MIYERFSATHIAVGIGQGMENCDSSHDNLQHRMNEFWGSNTQHGDGS